MHPRDGMFSGPCPGSRLITRAWPLCKTRLSQSYGRKQQIGSPPATAEVSWVKEASRLTSFKGGRWKPPPIGLTRNGEQGYAEVTATGGGLESLSVCSR